MDRSNTRRRASIFKLLGLSMLQHPELTEEHVDDAMKIWEACERAVARSGEFLGRSHDKYAAVTEYIWHTQQDKPVRNQKQVAAAYGLSQSVVSQTSKQLREYLRPVATSTEHTYATMKPDWFPSSLAALCEHMQKLVSLEVWKLPVERRLFMLFDDLELDYFAVVDGSSASDLRVGLSAEHGYERYMEFTRACVSGAVPLAGIIEQLNQVQLTHMSTFDDTLVVALVEAGITPIINGLYPVLNTLPELDSAREFEEFYSQLEGLIGALASQLTASAHVDAHTTVTISRAHHMLGQVEASFASDELPEYGFDPIQEVQNMLSTVTNPFDVVQLHTNDDMYYTLDVILNYSRPRISRRLRMRADCTLNDLHLAIQCAMEWHDAHLWQFSHAGTHQAIASARGQAKARQSTLHDLFDTPGTTQIDYLYDFGDSWEMRITLVDAESLPVSTPARELLDAKHPAPPEDCGGMPGFERLSEAARTGKDPWGEDIEELAQWYDLERLVKLDEAALLAQFNGTTRSATTPSGPRATSSGGGLAFDSIDPFDFRGEAPELEEVTQMHQEEFGELIVDLHRKHARVLDMVACYGVDQGWPMDFQWLAANTWLTHVMNEEVPVRKPNIYAGALVYALEMSCAPDPKNQVQVADALGTSTVSISKTYEPLLEVIEVIIEDMMEI